MEAKDVTEMKQNRNSREYVLEAVRKKGKLLELPGIKQKKADHILSAILRSKRPLM